MIPARPHRKRVKHYHEPGDLHELTFSCYSRLPLLTNNQWRRWLARCIDEANREEGIRLAGFVFMPEHVHLLVWPCLPSTPGPSSGATGSASASGATGSASALSGNATVCSSADPTTPNIGRYLALIKQPLSKQIKQTLIENNSKLLDRLIVTERPGKRCFRFWQEGPGYDRNLNQPDTIQNSLDYIHNNPVTRGLCRRAIDWKWSTARWYLLDPPKQQDPDLPFIHGLPPGTFDR